MPDWQHRAPRGGSRVALGPTLEAHNHQKALEKTRCSTKTKQKQSFVIKARTSSKLGWHAGKTANSNISVTQNVWPLEVRRQQSSIFDILKETSQQNNVGSRLQFVEDVWYENDVFHYPPWRNSKISIFEGCLKRNHQKSMIVILDWKWWLGDPLHPQIEATGRGSGRDKSLPQERHPLDKNEFG